MEARSSAPKKKVPIIYKKSDRKKVGAVKVIVNPSKA